MNSQENVLDQCKTHKPQIFQLESCASKFQDKPQEACLNDHFFHELRYSHSQFSGWLHRPFAPNDAEVQTPKT